MKNNEKMIDEGISRRDLLLGAGAAAAVLASGMVHGEEHTHEGHMMHLHENHAPKYTDLLDDVNNCVDKGQRCISHCFVAFREGDVSLADCASKAQEMLAVCKGFSYLVTSNSVYLKDYAKICRAVCSDCEAECNKHADKHQECKNCEEACARVVKAIDAMLA